MHTGGRSSSDLGHTDKYKPRHGFPPHLSLAHHRPTWFPSHSTYRLTHTGTHRPCHPEKQVQTPKQCRSAQHHQSSPTLPSLPSCLLSSHTAWPNIYRHMLFPCAAISSHKDAACLPLDIWSSPHSYPVFPQTQITKPQPHTPSLKADIPDMPYS